MFCIVFDSTLDIPFTLEYNNCNPLAYIATKHCVGSFFSQSLLKIKIK